MGYEISTCQMQYDANNKEMDKKDLEGMVLENVEREIKYHYPLLYSKNFIGLLVKDFFFFLFHPLRFRF